MKTHILLSLVVVAVLVGCSDSSKKPESAATNAPAAQTNAPTSSGNPLTAPVDYLNAAVKAQQSAVKTVDVTSLNKALDMFNVQEGRFPKDLNELVTKKYLPEIPKPAFGTKIEYDAAAGTVKVVKQ
jgi:ABC-type enterochelin transport system substrate-binding protein